MNLIENLMVGVFVAHVIMKSLGCISKKKYLRTNNCRLTAQISPQDGPLQASGHTVEKCTAAGT